MRFPFPSRSGPRSRGRASSEAGFTLIEMTVSVFIFSIAISIAFGIVYIMARQSVSQVDQSRATEAAQVAQSGITQYLQGTVAPVTAAQAGLTVGVTAAALAALAANSPQMPCWSNSSPAPSPPSPVLVRNPTGLATANIDGQSTPVTDPMTQAIIYAHDYDIQFCSYTASSSTPHVYEIFIDFSSCQTTGGGAIYGYCNLDVVDDGAFPAGTLFPAADYNNHSCATCKIVDVVPKVWCDSACQDTATTYGAVPHASCWDYLPKTSSGAAQTPPPTPSTTQALPTGSPSYPSNCAGINSANEAGYTPPLFQYFSSGAGAAVAPLNNASDPFDLICSQDSISHTCTGLAINGSVDDTGNLISSGIQTIRIDLTILADVNTHLPSPHGNPGTTVIDDIWLTNLVPKQSTASST